MSDFLNILISVYWDPIINFNTIHRRLSLINFLIFWTKPSKSAYMCSKKVSHILTYFWMKEILLSLKLMCF